MQISERCVTRLTELSSSTSDSLNLMTSRTSVNAHWRSESAALMHCRGDQVAKTVARSMMNSYIIDLSKAVKMSLCKNGQLPSDDKTVIIIIIVSMNRKENKII